MATETAAADGLKCPISFEAFKSHQDSSGAPDRRLYVIHAHTYFPYSTQADQKNADQFHAEIKARFAGVWEVRIGAIVPMARGLHPRPQFETAFTKPHLTDVLPWMMFNRPEDFSIMLHPFTSHLVEDHTSSAAWLGQNLGLHLESLAKLQQQVALAVESGQDESELLWPYV